jgi:hypothetical protein
MQRYATPVDRWIARILREAVSMSGSSSTAVTRTHEGRAGAGFTLTSDRSSDQTPREIRVRAGFDRSTGRRERQCNIPWAGGVKAVP